MLTRYLVKLLKLKTSASAHLGIRTGDHLSPIPPPGSWRTLFGSTALLRSGSPARGFQQGGAGVEEPLIAVRCCSAPLLSPATAQQVDQHGDSLKHNI